MVNDHDGLDILDAGVLVWLSEKLPLRGHMPGADRVARKFGKGSAVALHHQAGDGRRIDDRGLPSGGVERVQRLP